MKIDGNKVRQNISRNITKYREMNGISQKELASKLGTSPSRVSNWEQGANSPNIEILFELCRILDVSINDIYGVYPDSSVSVSYEEILHLKKYRSLDAHGKDAVDAILQLEYDRVSASNSYTYLDAAHARTDIDVTDDLNKHDDDVIDDPNF